MKRRWLACPAACALAVVAFVAVTSRVVSAAKPAAGDVIKVHASDVGGVMVLGNLTVTEPAAAGFTTAYPCAEGRPLASNNNYVAGETTPNFVAVRADVNGDVCLYTQASAQLIWDQVAELPGLTVHNANRLVDTRNEGNPPPSPPPLPAAQVGTAASSLAPDDAPDPFVLSVDPSYCVTASNPAPAACYYAYTTRVFYLCPNVPEWRSTDLVTWTKVIEPPVHGDAMPQLAPWAEFGYNWAPSVIERPANPPDARFVMWYTAKDKTSGRQCLGVATASTPTGPFIDTNTAPALCGGGDHIDASPFVDDDGTAYLTYKSSSPAGLRIARLADDGRTLVGGTERGLLSEGTPGDGDRIVEGPTMIRAGGQLYLFYSRGDWWTADYQVGVLRCDSVFGPGTPIYGTAVLATRGSMAGPGGQTPFQSVAGDWYVMFHAWTSPAIGYPSGARSLRLLPLTFTDGNVRIG